MCTSIEKTRRMKRKRSEPNESITKSCFGEVCQNFLSNTTKNPHKNYTVHIKWHQQETYT